MNKILFVLLAVNATLFGVVWYELMRPAEIVLARTPAARIEHETERRNATPRKADKPAATSAAALRMFGEGSRAFAKRPDVSTSASLTETPLRLVGVIFFGPAAHDAIALIQKGVSSGSVRVTMDSEFEGWRVAAIHAKSLDLVRPGERRTLRLDPDKAR
jgi:hypothetical protein